MTARRCSTSSRPFRAMSCSRPASRNSTASSPASSACRSARAFACCCGATRFGVSIPAWCSCRGRNTTRRSGSASRKSFARHSPRSAWNRRCRSPNRTSRASTSWPAPARAKRPASTPTPWSGGSPPRCAPGPTDSRPRCCRASTKPTHCSCSRNMPRPFPPPTPRTSWATPPRSTSHFSKPSRRNRLVCTSTSTGPILGARTSSS